MEKNGEVNLLDVVVFVAEYWMWIVILPLLVGIAAFLFFSLMPQQYQVQTHLGIPEAKIAEYLYSASEHRAVEAVSVTSAQYGLESELTIIRSTPAKAQAAMTSVLSQIRAGVEGGTLILREVALREQIDMLSTIVLDRQRYIAVMRQAVDEIERAPTRDLAQYASALSTLDDMMTGWREDVELLSELRASLPQDGRQTYSPPESVRVGRPPAILAGAAALFSAILCLAAIFFLKFVMAMKHSEDQEKYDRIRKGLLLHRWRTRE